MLKWWKSLFAKTPAPKPPKIKSRGLFSTDNDFLFDARLSESDNLALAMSRSIQRPLSGLKISTKNGDIKVTQAMDEAYPDLQLAKLNNNLGGFLPSIQMCWYASQGFIGYQTAAILAQNWLINKACTIPARDAVRHGYELTINDGTDVSPEEIDEIRRLDKKYRVKAQMTEFIRMGRIFGIRIMLFEVKSSDPQYYEKPFNIDGVKPGSYLGMSQIDPYWITPELDMQAAASPASQHFYEPTWWFVSGRRIHRTHLVIYRNAGQLPDVLKPTYFYGGIPLPQLIYERVYAAERTANEAPMLAMSKRMTILKVDMSKALADLPVFQQKMEWFTALQNNFGVKAIGEDEEMEQFDTSLSEFDVTVMTQYQLVAAIAETPATKLLGTSPKGFGASGEYEESSYHEMLESLQEHDLTPVLDRHHELLVRSELGRKGNQEYRIEHTWKPTDTPTAKEQAEINKLKADTDTAWIMGGAIDGTDVRKRVVEDPDSGYSGFPEVVPDGPGDREAQQAAEAALEQPVQDKPGKAGAGKDARIAMDSEFTGTALQSSGFNIVTGMLNDARLVTHQRFLDGPKVDEKIANNDFMVNVSPEFEDEGKKYRMILDGHHSLAAAVKARVMPVFVESLPRGPIFNAVTREATDVQESPQGS